MHFHNVESSTGATGPRGATGPMCITCNAINVEELEQRACKLAAFTNTTIATGNAVVLFTMLLSQEILEQLALNPVANVSLITPIATSIASLNNSIKIDP